MRRFNTEEKVWFLSHFVLGVVAVSLKPLFHTLKLYTIPFVFGDCSCK